MRPDERNRLASIPSATGGIARLACTVLSKAEKPLAPLLAAADLTTVDISDASRRLEVKAEIGLPYYVMSSSESLAEALRNAERYSAVTNDGVRLKVRQDRDAVIEIEY